MQVAKDMVVSMHYTLTLNDGQVVDTSADHGPLNFLVGHKQIIPGLEDELMGMAVGDKKKVVVQAKDAYGEHDEKLVEKVERDKIPADIELKEGLILRANREDGQVMEFTVKSFDDSEVVFDLNHPLAGQVLTFDTEIVDIRQASQEEVDHGHVH